jgi:hypothetical protein
MTDQEWKDELTERINCVISEYERLLAHMEKLETIENDVDIDELGAFMLIKLSKMKETINTLVG